MYSVIFKSLVTFAVTDFVAYYSVLIDEKRVID